MLVAVDQSRSMTLCASHDQHIRQRTLQAVRFAARRNLAANPQVSSSTSSQSQQSFKYVKAISSRFPRIPHHSSTHTGWHRYASRFRSAAATSICFASPSLRKLIHTELSISHSLLSALCPRRAYDTCPMRSSCPFHRQANPVKMLRCSTWSRWKCCNATPDPKNCFKGFLRGYRLPRVSDPGHNRERFLLQVRSAVASVLGRWPSESHRPVVRLRGMRTGPIVHLSFRSVSDLDHSHYGQGSLGRPERPENRERCVTDLRDLMSLSSVWTLG
mgnify:CR=1 FL=1